MKPVSDRFAAVKEFPRVLLSRHLRILGKVVKSLALIAVFAAAGAFIGSGIGIVASGGARNGMGVFAGIGAVLGFVTALWINAESKAKAR